MRVHGRLPDGIDPDVHVCWRCGATLNSPRCNGGTHECRDCVEVEREIRWEAEAAALGVSIEDYFDMKRRRSEQAKRRAEEVKRDAA